MPTRQLVLFLASAAALSTGVAGCATPSATPAAAEPSESGGQVGKPKGRKIKLEATGTGTATITYTFGAKSGQKAGARLPWTMSGEHNGSLDAVYNVIVTSGEQGSKVRCRILLDGKPVKTGKGEGAFASADCAVYGADIR